VTESGGLLARDLERYYGQWKVVDGVTIDVKRGEVIGLLGPNGAGKTTTFYLIVGLLRADSGAISVDGRDITRTPMHRRARMGIGYLQQEPSIFRRLTVRENILAILETLPMKSAERAQRLEQLLDELNITHLADRKGYHLSGGERRRVEITRALVTQPGYLLLDEPFVGIDPIAVAEIQDIVRRLKAKGLGILITDHNVRETLSTTDRAYIMFEGRILLQGTSQELAQDPVARQIYLGERFRLD
jgi:lipopolysaccharide export system ATP-binding protein